MKYLLIIILASCQSIDTSVNVEPTIPDTIEDVVEEEIEVEPVSTHYCLPYVDLATHTNTGAFYWESGEDLNDSMDIIAGSLTDQGYIEDDDFTLETGYYSKYSVTGVFIAIDAIFDRGRSCP